MLVPSTPTTHTGAIVGGIIGAFVGIAIVAALIVVYMKRRRGDTQYELLSLLDH